MCKEHNFHSNKNIGFNNNSIQDHTSMTATNPFQLIENENGQLQ